MEVLFTEMLVVRAAAWAARRVSWRRRYERVSMEEGRIGWVQSEVTIES